jgi:hypothetical protein
MNQNLRAPAKHPPFENREGWGSLIRFTQRVDQPAPIVKSLSNSESS